MYIRVTHGSDRVQGGAGVGLHVAEIGVAAAPLMGIGQSGNR